jgi:hypothetical protein
MKFQTSDLMPADFENRYLHDLPSETERAARWVDTMRMIPVLRIHDSESSSTRLEPDGLD